jgi:hypothetical protein
VPFIERSVRLGDPRVPQRFWDKTQPQEDGCWLWSGNVTGNGYGQIEAGGRKCAAHRFSYTLLVGDIGPSLTIDHLCRQPLCVNPSHLEQVTRWENVRRGNTVTGANHRKTHCFRGHALTRDNTYDFARITGSRKCKECRRAYLRNRRLRNKLRFQAIAKREEEAKP